MYHTLGRQQCYRKLQHEDAERSCHTRDWKGQRKSVNELAGIPSYQKCACRVLADARAVAQQPMAASTLDCMMSLPANEPTNGAVISGMERRT